MRLWHKGEVSGYVEIRLGKPVEDRPNFVCACPEHAGSCNDEPVAVRCLRVDYCEIASGTYLAVCKDCGNWLEDESVVVEDFAIPLDSKG